MKNMIVRALAGAVYVGLILLCIYLGAGWFGALMLLFGILAMNELQSLMSRRVPVAFGIRLFDIAVGVALLGCPVFLGYARQDGHYIEIIIACAALMVLYMPVRMILAVFDRSGSPARSAMCSAFSLMYVVLSLCCLTACYWADWHVVLATFVFIWINDTGAYLSGMSMGRTKLCERLSPKKTWEGFWGGFVLCVGAGWVAAWLLDAPSAGVYAAWMGYAAAVSVFGTFGDLFESLLKRTVEVKDSGNLIPGHGGILDRIDSLLAVGPLALAFAAILFSLSLA